MVLNLYPFEFEQFWINGAADFLQISDIGIEHLREFEKDIQLLSDLFTTQRPDVFLDYTQGRLLWAYGLFFFPQAFARIQFILAELCYFCRWKPMSRPLRILDLGAGLGAAGLAASLFLRDCFGCQVEYVALDHSQQALKGLEKMYASLGNVLKNIQLQTICMNICQEKSFEEGFFDCILSSFAWNEIFSEATFNKQVSAVINVAKSLNENGLLIFTEPALKVASVNLQKLADELVVNHQFHRWGPGNYGTGYPHLEDTPYFPHEVRGWKAPESVHFLNRHLFRQVNDLKYHFMALSASHPLRVNDTIDKSWVLCRLTTPMRFLKGRVEWSGLTQNGELYHYQCFKRDLSKISLNILLSIERGDIVYLDRLEPLKALNTFRVPGFDHFRSTFKAAAALTRGSFYDPVNLL